MIGKIFLFQLIVLVILLNMLAGCKKSIGDSPPVISPGVEIVTVNRVAQVQQLYSINQDTSLNSSNSDSWVQCASDGTVGMVYREIREVRGSKGKNSTNTGTMDLIYKTIKPGGNITGETVTSGDGVNKSVFVYDSDDQPHIFFARSADTQQEIFHFFKNNDSGWGSEKVVQFSNHTGQYILELNAAVGPGDTLHLLALKTGTHPVDDFFYAHRNSYLFYISNQNGVWIHELIQHFDTVYLHINVRNDGVPYWYMRVFKRQDLAIDAAGHAHAAYAALRHQGWEPYPTEMRYANNISGRWDIEAAVAPSDDSCDAGANPSIAIDNQGRVVLASTFIERVPSKSAEYAQLLYSYREETGNWQHVSLVNTADGYLGADGGNFTGAMPHLALDSNSRPHIVFADVASTHMWGGSVLNIGQVRYARYTGSRWELSTLYPQLGPTDYDSVREMHGQCLAISNNGSVQIIGQEFLADDQNRTYNLLHLILQ